MLQKGNVFLYMKGAHKKTRKKDMKKELASGKVLPSNASNPFKANCSLSNYWLERCIVCANEALSISAWTVLVHNLWLWPVESSMVHLGQTSTLQFGQFSLASLGLVFM